MTRWFVPVFLGITMTSIFPGVSRLAEAQGPMRAFRRGPLPGIAVYVGPGYLYPGTLAPWGSIPASFYAASYPLPLYAARPAVQTSYCDSPDRNPTPYRTRPQRPPQPFSPSAKDAPVDHFAPERSGPKAAPETIPAPRPLEIQPSIRNSTPKPPLPRPYESGPREF